MLIDIRALADHFLIALPNINSRSPSFSKSRNRRSITIDGCHSSVEMILTGIILGGGKRLYPDKSLPLRTHFASSMQEDVGRAVAKAVARMWKG